MTTVKAESYREMTRIVKAVLDVPTAPIVGRSALVRTIISRWPVGVTPPPDAEVVACVNRMVHGGLLERCRPKSPSGKWVEPHYRFYVKAPAPRTIVYFSISEFNPRDSSICCRCQAKIPGRGRHAKSKRGHGKAECDLEMVRVYMSL